MSNELSTKNYVIVTRHFGKFYIDKTKAESLDKLFDLPDHQRPYRIEIDDDTKIIFSDIVGVTSAAKLDEVEREKKGEWKCSQGNWHDKFDQCKSNWGIVKPTVVADEELSPERKERAAIIAEMREKGMLLKDMIKLKGKSNEELRLMLSQM